DTAGVTTLIVESAVYRAGAPLRTVAERRAAVEGWGLAAFDIDTLLRSSPHGETGLALTLYHQDPGQARPELIGRVGRARGSFAHSARLDVDGVWTVRVKGAPIATGPGDDLQALAILLVGLLGTALLSTLVIVLARQRERALAMVA